MGYNIVGVLIFTLLIGSIIFIVLQREKQLISNLESRRADLKIVDKLIPYAKLRNHGVSIEKVVNNLKTVNIEYTPKNSL